MDLTKLSLEELAAYAAERREALSALFAVEVPTDEQVTEAEGIGTEIEAADAQIATVEAAATERADKFTALKTKFAPVEPDPEDKADEPDPEDEKEDDEPEAAGEALVAASDAPRNTVKTLARKSKRPVAPANADTRPKISITAAAEVEGFATGASISDLTRVGAALQGKVKSFPRWSHPRGAREGDSDIRKSNVAQFNLDFPKELTIARGIDDMEVLNYATQEARLPGNSLVAAGGWCAPSETIYDLCEGETLDGILSVPEVNIARGGINYTSGPSFADFYGEGFTQTEAQAIAGVAKDCYEITCPPFSEVRLDAVGLCIKVPILTNAAYPELTRRIVAGSLIAHQHRINASVITRMVAASGAARVVTGLGATVNDSLEALELLADERREQYRLGISIALEVVVPFWIKAAYKSDLGRRNGVAAEAVTDADILAHFAARNLKVSFVYDWQPIGQTAEVYPATYQALLYPSGTFIKGVADVINLSAVYDAASLSVNTYTGTFVEQGLLVAKMCFGSDLVTLPICNAGRTGAANLTCV